MDCYLSKVLKSPKGYIATVDVADGRCISGIERRSKDRAEKDLKLMNKKLKVKLIEDPRLFSSALSREERKLIYNCMQKGIDYKNKLVDSRIKRERFTTDKLDIKDQLVLDKEMR
jgi:hypothetical protein